MCSENQGKYSVTQMEYDRKERERFSLPLNPTDIEKKLIEWAKQQQSKPLFREKKFCEACGTTERLEYHEIIYTPLRYVILCKKCHAGVHHFVYLLKNQKELTEEKDI